MCICIQADDYIFNIRRTLERIVFSTCDIDDSVQKGEGKNNYEKD